MRYEGDIYRPPSEAYSLLVQVTIGCTHNKCTFCKMFKNKKFRVRKLEEVLEDLAWARAQYRSVPRIFLCDGDAMALSNARLMPILNYIKENFPECERVSIYGRGSDIIKKTDDEMKELYDAGLTMVYVGAESGSDKVLKAICKGETRQQIIDGVKKVEACGMKSSVTFISGLAGREGWEDHAIETGTMITEMQSSLRGASDADRGAERSDGEGNRRRYFNTAYSGGNHGGNASDAGACRCVQDLRAAKQSRI